MSSEGLNRPCISVVRRAEHLADIEDTVNSMLEGLPWNAPEHHEKKFAELGGHGFTRLSLPEDRGGSGGDLVDFAAVLRQCGYAGLNAPVLEEFLSAWLLGQTDGVSDPRSHCIAVAPFRGNRLVRWAEEQRPCLLLAEEGGRAWLNVVAGRSTADRTLAGEPLGVVDWDGSITSPSASESTISFGDFLIRQALLRSAMIVGAAESAFNQALKYSSERQQFGRRIGNFQAVAQSLSAIAGEITLASVSLDVGLSQAIDDTVSKDEQDISALVAIVEARTIAGKVARMTHQIHGAIGFTAEHSLHISTRRLWSWRDDGGNESYWARQLADIAQEKGPEIWKFLG